MLKLTYANRTEDLLEVLAEALKAERQQFGIWEPIQLVVPNPNVKRYLLDGLGRSLGVLANYQVNYLDGLWRAPLNQMVPPVRLWNRHALQGAILSVLSGRDALEAPDLAPLMAYLKDDGSGLKLLQLAEKTAGLLEDYSLSRPEWARAWARNPETFVTGAPIELEAWQRGLWQRILAGAVHGPERWTTLAGLLKDGLFDTIPLPPRIHVFGLSYAAEVYHRAFEAAANRVDVLLYALNPCEEYWDDLPSEAEVRREAQQRKHLPPEALEDDPYGLESAADPLLLRRWGRPGRENIRLLNEISGCDFKSAFPDPAPTPTTLLEHIQDDLRYRKASAAGTPDASLRFLACPSPAREAEVVASEIWQIMEAAPADRPLRFSDIAVVVPPSAGLRTAYIDHLRTAFDATGHIPMVVVDAPLPALATLLDGAELFLDLPTGRGSRRDLLRALTHPSVLARFPDTESDAWARWADAAGIVRGLGPEDLQDETLLEPGFLHWEQGLERLALSAFLPPNQTWSGVGFERPSAHAGAATSIAVFVDRAGSLVRKLRTLRGMRATPEAWADQIATFLLHYLGSDEAADAPARSQLAKSLQRIRDLVPKGMTAPALNYRQARELARQAIASVRGEAGGRPHQGVVVGSYAPMRALPFRAVILMGLGEGQFPSPEERQPLDLRNAKRKAGDVGAAERDRYLFLEMVLGARETLRLTYPNEDPVSREKRLPSSLLQDLVQSLAPVSLDQLQEQHFRYRFDEAYFPAAGTTTLHSLATTAAREAQARQTGPLLAASVPRMSDKPWSALALPPGLRMELDALLAPCPVPARKQRSEPVLTLRLTHLRNWLECPLQGTARVRLRLRGDEEELADLEEEVLGTSSLVKASLRREVLLRSARWGVALSLAYHEARRAYLRSGKAAPGIFGQPEVQVDLALLARQFQALRGEAIRLVRFGPSTNPDEEADEVHAPLELTVQVQGISLKVHLVGSLQPQVANRSLFMTPKAGVASKGGVTEEFRLKLLRAYLDQHLLATASEEPLIHGALGLAGANEKGKEPGAYRFTVEFPAITPVEATAQLTSWITELLNTKEPGLLPIEAIFKEEHLDPEGLQEWVLDKAEDDRNHSAFKNGPLRAAERFDLDPNPAETANRRLGDFLACTLQGTIEVVS